MHRKYTISPRCETETDKNKRINGKWANRKPLTEAELKKKQKKNRRHQEFLGQKHTHSDLWEGTQYKAVRG